MAEREWLDGLFSATYEELRRLAARVRRDDRGATLNPTALVNEAYLKLIESSSLPPVSRLHFRRIAARAMRQVLVDAARRRHAHKRGGSVTFVTLDETREGEPASSGELLTLDGALDDLARLHERQAQVVELRFFGGLSLSEIAAVLEVSEATVDRDWRAARAWLARELSPAR